MSTPRDRDEFDDLPDDARGWQEPASFGSSAGGPDIGPGIGPGSGLPGDAGRAPDQGEPTARPSRRGSLGTGAFWRPRGDVARVFADDGDLLGAQSWALSNGWTISDGTGHEDAVLQDLIVSAPVRATKEHRAAGVLRGRAGSLELVAFDVVFPLSGRWVQEYAITAAPLLLPLPGFRLSPARFWRHRTAGLVPLASGNEEFDARWLLLAAADDPRLHRLIQDPTVQGMLLASDDGDEFWAAAGHVAAIRPDGHRPLLIEHHARLLGAMLPALTAEY
jgi:hypothetical protein